MSQKKYSVICNSIGTASPATLANLIGGTTVRPRAYEASFGSTPVAPVDQAATIMMTRTTAIGTAGSTPTPASLDNQEVPSITTGAIAHTGEPTKTSPFLWQVGLNHRASWRWVANQDYELMAAASATNGVCLTQSANTANYGHTGVLLFLE
jgi:hypothetical protein